jgi:hypothetical protein
MLLLLILLSLLLWIDRETTRVSTASGFVKLPMLVRDDNDDDNDNVDRFDTLVVSLSIHNSRDKSISNSNIVGGSFAWREESNQR